MPVTKKILPFIVHFFRTYGADKLFFILLLPTFCPYGARNIPFITHHSPILRGQIGSSSLYILTQILFYFDAVANCHSIVLYF
jgi:hypothetical protein